MQLRNRRWCWPYPLIGAGTLVRTDLMRFDGGMSTATTETATISVFLVDDNVIVREGVWALLAFEDDLENRWGGG